MVGYHEVLGLLRLPEQNDVFAQMYGQREGVALRQRERYKRITKKFGDLFGKKDGIRFFSAPGRVEIIGNHTDHNKGQVLAAAVSLDSIAAVVPMEDVITLYSSGYKEPFVIQLADLAPREEHDTAALIRGVVARMQELGRAVGGFEAVVTSDVLPGSGLSSSAAFEVLVATLLDGLYGAGDMDPILRAKICQWAENNYMNKPCGLMDQMASSVGGLVSIGFGSAEPKVQPMAFDFAQKGYALAMVATDSSHDDLTEQYALIPREMCAVAQALGAQVLSGVTREAVLEDIAMLRKAVGDRAVLRALHFFDENDRVCAAVKALKNDQIDLFFEQVNGSGESSWCLLQNMYTSAGTHQPLAVAVDAARRQLRGAGACRLHGGGFAGTMLAFVPQKELDAFTEAMEGIFGNGACQVLDIRPQGAGEVKLYGA